MKPAFTKVHFEAIAKVIADVSKFSGQGTDDITAELAKLFAESNPNFDHAKFIKACRGSK